MAFDADTFEMYAGMMGNDFGADKEALRARKICLAGGVTPFKQILTGMLVGAFSSAEGFAMTSGSTHARAP